MKGSVLNSPIFLTKNACRPFHSKFLTNFVPKHVEPDKMMVKSLYERLQSINGRVIVLTGAGVSTESGIPDYRSDEVGRFARTNQRPLQYHQVVKSPGIYRRFWARNYVAYPTFARFKPNINHQILAEWERENRIYWLITQNVDSLHRLAGSERLIEMHGTMNAARCLKCDWRMGRADFQRILSSRNPGYLKDVKPTAIAPDGDVDLPDEKIKDFQPPVCPECSYNLVLPDVIFFGDNMPLKRRLDIDERVDKADGLLILGSTISVQSAYRIVKRMYDRRRFIGMVNIGTTCVDDMMSYRVAQSKCSLVLKELDQLFKDQVPKARDIAAHILGMPKEIAAPVPEISQPRTPKESEGRMIFD